jgi:glycosyltransferase involved in cell wall biosynthesis
MNNPLVSIIIPTYNRGNLISELLDSILAQSYRNWECIIIDDGSHDNTDEIVHSYVEKDNRFQYHKRPNHYKSGGNGARNYGFELSKGEYVNWFDSDDIMLNNFIKEKLSGFVNEKIQLVICGGNNYVNNVIEEPLDIYETDNLFGEYLQWRLKLITNSVLLKKSFLINKPLFNPDIKRGQETEFFSRIFFRLSPDFYKIITKPLFLYRQHEDTKTYKNKTYNKEFKESQTYIAIENLKRSIIIGDKELINYYYKSLLTLFFRALDNRHKNNIKFILIKFTALLMKISSIVAMQFALAGWMMYLLNRGSFRLEKYFKSYKF